MHMADALITPAIGGAMWGAAAVTTVYCARKVREDLDENAVPLMGVTGAFVFAAQMLNFSIPGTGSSGHIGGGLLLAALLGPHAAFIVILSVLAIQALFFADGGLLALGANAFNLGFFPAFIAFPLVYRAIVRDKPTPRRILAGSLAGAVVGLQFGAVAVVMQTTLSGVIALPFSAFALMMQPIHLAIGIVEGLITAGVITFVYRMQPDILTVSDTRTARPSPPVVRPILITLLAAALLSGSVLAWFASSDPDGLEWAIQRVSGTEEIEGAGSGVHDRLASAQRRLSFLPDYGFSGTNDSAERTTLAAMPLDPGTSLAGVVGGGMTLLFTGLLGLALRKRARRTADPT